MNLKYQQKENEAQKDEEKFQDVLNLFQDAEDTSKTNRRKFK